MTIQDIIAMCPRNGHAIGYTATDDPQGFKNTVESDIDKALIKLIRETPNPIMKAFYCGIYSAYVNMTEELVPWNSIRFMLMSAAEWQAEEVEEYMEGRV